MNDEWRQFEHRVEQATGLPFDDVIRLAEEQERLDLERLNAAGFCCEEGAVVAPDPCGSHPAHRNPDPWTLRGWPARW